MSSESLSVLHFKTFTVSRWFRRIKVVYVLCSQIFITQHKLISHQWWKRTFWVIQNSFKITVVTIFEPQHWVCLKVLLNIFKINLQISYYYLSFIDKDSKTQSTEYTSSNIQLLINRAQFQTRVCLIPKSEF